MKKVLIALAPTMMQEIDHIAKAEHRSRSDLVREGLRRYIEDFRRKQATLAPVSPPVAVQ